MILVIDLLDLALSDVSRTRSWPSWQIVTFDVSYEAPSSKVDKLMYSLLCIFSNTFVGMGGMPSTIMEVIWKSAYPGQMGHWVKLKNPKLTQVYNTL